MNSSWAHFTWSSVSTVFVTFVYFFNAYQLLAFYDKNCASKKSMELIILYYKWNRRTRKTFDFNLLCCTWNNQRNFKKYLLLWPFLFPSLYVLHVLLETRLSMFSCVYPSISTVHKLAWVAHSALVIQPSV